MVMHVLLLSLSLSKYSHAIPVKTEDTGQSEDTGEVEDTGATKDSGSSGGSSSGYNEFYPPDDADGYGTSGPPRSLIDNSSGCGRGAFVIAAPLLLLGLRRRL